MISNSSMTDYLKQYEGEIYIEQTWTTISIFLDGEKFTSQSTMTCIHISTESIFDLKWEYVSKKKPKYSGKDYMHTGMSRVQLNRKTNPGQMAGDYFTDKAGTITET